MKLCFENRNYHDLFSGIVKNSKLVFELWKRDEREKKTKDVRYVKKEIVTIEGITASAGSFNHVVKAGKFLFLTSQLAVDLKTGTILGGDIGEQTKQALENIKFLLHSSGASMEDIVKVVVYLKNVTDFDEMNQVYQRYFKKGQEPARVTIQALSPIPGIDIEIEAIAVLP